jgi:hypothetical protein
MAARRGDDRRYFERLCALRELYLRRGPRDRVTVLRLDDAVRYAEALLSRSAASTV